MSLSMVNFLYNLCCCKRHTTICILNLCSLISMQLLPVLTNLLTTNRSSVHLFMYKNASFN